MTAVSDPPAALRALAVAARATGSTRSALMAWPEHAPPSLGKSLARVTRLLHVGIDPVPAVASLEPVLGALALPLANAVRTSLTTGASLSALVEGLADVAEQDSARAHDAAAATAGTRSSSHLIAGLAVSSVLVMGLTGKIPSHPAEIVATGLGAVLIVVGIAWLRHLMPVPPADAAVCRIAEATAAVMRAGSPAAIAIELAGRDAPAPLATHVEVARRRVGLGLTWAEALARADDAGLRELGEILLRHHRVGLSVAEDLRDLAATRRARHDREFHRATRRAAVAMIVPLATCLLPGFVLIGSVSFIRGLSFAA